MALRRSDRRRIVTYPVEHGILEDRGRLSHRGEPEHIYHVPHFHRSVLRTQNAHALPFSLQEKSMPRLLIFHNSPNSHPVSRRFSSREALAQTETGNRRPPASRPPSDAVSDWNRAASSRV